MRHLQLIFSPISNYIAFSHNFIITYVPLLMMSSCNLLKIATLILKINETDLLTEVGLLIFWETLMLVVFLDTSKEIKYSNWLKYENLLKKHCLYISVYEYKWNQDDCNTTKRFLCQTGSWIYLKTHTCTFWINLYSCKYICLQYL